MTHSTEQTYETFLRASPDQVWDALTNPEHTERYFFGTRISIEPRAGGAIAYRLPDGALMVDGEIQSIRPGTELVHTWRSHYDPSSAGEVSKVTLRLEPRGDATKLTVIHDLASAPRTAKGVASEGWSTVLSSMKTLLETGAPLSIGPAR
jgi:uncharacterized protein YndB with AHSA1/START domain